MNDFWLVMKAWLGFFCEFSGILFGGGGGGGKGNCPLIFKENVLMVVQSARG